MHNNCNCYFYSSQAILVSGGVSQKREKMNKKHTVHLKYSQFDLQRDFIVNSE